MAAGSIHINGHNFISALRRSHHRRPSGRPIRITVAQSSSYLTSIQDHIEAHLKRVIPLRQPLSVFEPLHHLAFTAPESTAPALCIAACELLGGHRYQAIAAASALHLMHAASYVHEQIPLSGQPRSNPNPTPRPGPTFRPNIQLLTGDGMIPFGLELLTKYDSPDEDHSDRILRVIIEITRAIGSQGVVGGQYFEAQYRESESGNTGSTRLMAEKKWCELHACGAACGAILGGGSEEEVGKLRKYGFYAGTIQKLSKLEEYREVMEEMRGLALNELEHFEAEKVEAISSFINV